MFLRTPYWDRLTARSDGGFLLVEGDGGEGGGGAAAADTGTAAPQRTILGGGAAGATGEGSGSAAANASGTAGDTAGNGAGPWGDNWRDVAGEDAAARAILERITTPSDLIKKLVSQEQTIRSGRHKAPTLPDGATPEEVAAYRKAVGIPEAPDGYGLAFPETFTVSDADKETLTAFQAHMHEANVPPTAAKAAFEFYVKQMGEQAAARAEQAEEATLQSLAQLRGEFKGREYERQMRIADEFLMTHFGNEPETLQALNEVLTMRLPNGVPIMYHAPFMKGLFKMAAAHADDEALIGGDIIGAGKSIEQEYNDLIKKSVEKPREMSEADNTRLQELAAARVRQSERAGRQAI